MSLNSSNRKAAKTRFSDEAEEKKYIAYLQHVETLNKMKD